MDKVEKYSLYALAGLGVACAPALAGLVAIGAAIYHGRKIAQEPVQVPDEKAQEKPMADAANRSNQKAASPRSSFSTRLSVFDDGIPEAGSFAATLNDRRSNAESKASAVRPVTPTATDAPCTNKVKKAVKPDRAAAEAMLDERFNDWRWTDDWNEIAPVSFADVLADSIVYTVYFDRYTGQPTSVEAPAEPPPPPIYWEDEAEINMKLLEINPTDGNLVTTAKKFVKDSYARIEALFCEVAASEAALMLPCSELPADDACWEYICELSREIWSQRMPVIMYRSGACLRIAVNEADIFRPEEIREITSLLSKEHEI